MRVFSVFGVTPMRFGGTEAFARELSIQLERQEAESVLCFLAPPPEAVRSRLGLPNVAFEVLEGVTHPTPDSCQRLWHLLRLHRPGILHLHFVGFVSPYAWIARLAGVRRVFFTDQTSLPSGFVPRRAPLWKRAAVRLINQPVSGLVSVSEFGLRSFTALDTFPRSRCHRIYNAVDLVRAGCSGAAAGAAFRLKHGIPPGSTVVLQVSWIIPEKGIGDLLEAARLASAQDPALHFVFAGTGVWLSHYREQAAAMGLADRVTWTGLVEDPLGEGLFAAADIVCQVSRWQEVFGWVIAEAMATSKPVIGTCVGGIPELIRPGETGLLAECGAAADIAGHILTLARDRELRRKMGAAGRLVAEREFDLTQNVAELVALYTKRR